MEQIRSAACCQVFFLFPHLAWAKTPTKAPAQIRAAATKTVCMFMVIRLFQR